MKKERSVAGVNEEQYGINYRCPENGSRCEERYGKSGVKSNVMSSKISDVKIGVKIGVRSGVCSGAQSSVTSSVASGVKCVRSTK